MKAGKIVLPLIIILAAISFFSIFIVKETNQAIVLQFGKPMGESKTTAGFYFKTPFIQNVIKFEKN